jgi:hypothetical protein
MEDHIKYLLNSKSEDFGNKAVYGECV